MKRHIKEFRKESYDVGFHASVFRQNMALKITVIRHGQGEHNVHRFFSCNPLNPTYRPANLTEIGITQTQDTGHVLSKTVAKPEFIFHSPLPRTEQTASILQRLWGLSNHRVLSHWDLIEVDVGKFDGKPHSDFPYGAWEHSYNHNPDIQGETEADVNKRLEHFFTQIAAKLEDDMHIILVTHGTPALVFLEKHLGERVALKTAGFHTIERRLSDLK